MKRLLSLAMLLTFVVTTSSFAAGPLLIFDPATQTPYAWPGPVSIYTDLDATFSTTGPVTNAEADARMADAAAEWSGVATSSFSAAVAGDFGTVGLPEINGGNFGSVIGVFNGGGYHVIYDSDGAITAALAGPGVLGFSTPEFATGVAIDESYMVLNGTTVDPGDAGGFDWQGVFTHEMGHGINLAHTQTNGNILFFGDDLGPVGCALPYGGAPGIPDIETMYPFIDPSVGTGSGVVQGTVDLIDDMSSLSDIYPAPGYPASHGEISGVIYLSDGVTEITGINVVARNVADPFGDCASHVSGDFTQGGLGPDGRYHFTGLTPGADYVIYVQDIIAGGFSTTPAALPGPEEFWNGVDESADSGVDDKCAATAITVAAGAPETADIIFNVELNLGDDDSQEIPLPFPFTFCGTEYTSVWVGSNGYVTFGAGDTDLSESVADLLADAPRIAGLWDDLNPTAGGSISFFDGGTSFSIIYDSVPEYGTTNVNTFTITLNDDDSYSIDYGTIDATDGLAGSSIGNGLASDPGEIDLTAAAQPISGAPGDAVYELFDAADNDLDAGSFAFDPCEDFSPTINPAQMNVCYATGGGNDGGNFYTIDPVTGAATLVGPTGLGGAPGLAIDPTGNIWCTERITGSLYRIDAVTGQAFFQTTTDIDFIDAIAFDAAGTLYGVGFDAPDYSLRTIDTNTGATTVIGPTGDIIAGMAFHPVSGQLWASVGGFGAVNADGIYTIDTGSGAATLVGTTGLGGATPDIKFDMLGNLYGSKGGGGGANDLIRISQVDGSGTVIGPTGSIGAIAGLASWVDNPVPTTFQAFDAEALDGKVNVSWDVAVTGDVLVGFHVQRRSGNGNFVTVNTERLNSDARSYDDATALPGTKYGYRVVVITLDGEPAYSPEALVTTKSLQLALDQNHPNPFNPTTTIGFTVPDNSFVSLKIYDVAGRLVSTLVSENRVAGKFAETWNGIDNNGNRAASGLYFYRLTVGNRVLTKKMVMLK